MRNLIEGMEKKVPGVKVPVRDLYFATQRIDSSIKRAMAAAKKGKGNAMVSFLAYALEDMSKGLESMSLVVPEVAVARKKLQVAFDAMIKADKAVGKKAKEGGVEEL